MLETFVVEWALGPAKSGPDGEDLVVGPDDGPVTPEKAVGSAEDAVEVGASAPKARETVDLSHRGSRGLTL